MDLNTSFGEQNNNIKTIEDQEKNIKDNNEQNIFSSLTSKMKIDNEYSNGNIITYDSFLSKELIIYNLNNIFNILNTKYIIEKINTFHRLKFFSNKKITTLIQAEILYLKISSSILFFSKIFNKIKFKKLYKIFLKLKFKNKINTSFKQKYESNYKKTKDSIISDNSTKLKKIENENKDIEKSIKALNVKENSLKNEIHDLAKKEKQLSEKIKKVESFNINPKKSFQSSNISSINNNSKYDSEIISIENTIETNKQLKEGKEEIIKEFLFKMNDLLNEYQTYIDKLSLNNRSNSEKVEV